MERVEAANYEADLVASVPKADEEEEAGWEEAGFSSTRISSDESLRLVNAEA